MSKIVFVNLSMRNELMNLAKELGFSHYGVRRAEPARRLQSYMDWLSNGYQGEMAYMARKDRVERRKDLNLILDGVKSIITLGMTYNPPMLPEQLLNDPSRGRISSYAWGIDYHSLMLPRLDEMGRWLQKRAGAGISYKAYVDTGAILERDHAESSGLGFTGKNTMLIQPRRGSYLFLGEILATAELEPTSSTIGAMPSCGSCTRCLSACPTEAFPEPCVLDSRRCISYLTIEHKGWIPRELRPKMGNWIYGCDVCQEVCPFNRFAGPSEQTAFQTESWDSAAPLLIDVLSLTDEEFNARYANSPIKRIGRDRLVRNACIAAGNWGSPSAISALDLLLNDPSPIIRGHAAWALGQI
ncbi:MAG: tRNA epoxyqueuosine(34) reductase QueG, partial [Candidatus Promineifilaceae bacterium]